MNFVFVSFIHLVNISGIIKNTKKNVNIIERYLLSKNSFA